MDDYQIAQHMKEKRELIKKLLLQLYPFLGFFQKRRAKKILEKLEHGTSVH